ncbi:hypothetical protein PABG_07526 [Paracoccidioides brasiliensis Pb03]|nr:hypothetical protein PABG_07526 [Paracoccidioides brasiliensis Pb03]
MDTEKQSQGNSAVNDTAGDSSSLGLRQEETHNAETTDSTVPNRQSSEHPYTVLTEKEKICTIIISSFGAFLSPVSASIYLSILNSLSKDLMVSTAKINLSITAYMIFQALVPSIIGVYSDKNGRRPALLICFIVSLGANIGLAVQDSYIFLIALRCLQGSGSSGTIIISTAVTADVVTRSERGKYTAYSSLGMTLGQALGPLIGGILNHFFGWRSIFWFLTTYSGLMALLVVFSLPETSRSVVGNGARQPQIWNECIMDMISQKRQRRIHFSEDRTVSTHNRRPNPAETIKIAMEKETAILLFFSALLFAGYVFVLCSLPSQLERKYGFNSLQIGLCFLPYGFGSLASRWAVATLADWNFRRHCSRLGIRIIRNRQPQLSGFPLEAARLQIALPLVYLSCICITTYSWVMTYKTNLAGPLILLFFTACTISGAFGSVFTLIIDCHMKQPATAAAASNLFRCFFGAGAAAAAVPLITKLRIGWTGTIVASTWVISSPLLWGVMKWGRHWREEGGRSREGADRERI